MPKDFNNCVKNGGKVRHKTIKGGRYIKICYDKDGNSYSGGIKKKNFNKFKDFNEHKRVNAKKKLESSLLNLKEHFNKNYHHR